MRLKLVGIKVALKGFRVFRDPLGTMAPEKAHSSKGWGLKQGLGFRV